MGRIDPGAGLRGKANPAAPFGLKAVLRMVLALVMVVAGALHFLATEAYVGIMPAYLPLHRELVYLSGLFEILGGFGLLSERTRRAAGIGLIFLYVSVLPANVNMAIHEIQPGSLEIPTALLWARIPLQLVFIAWAWWVSRPAPATPHKEN